MLVAAARARLHGALRAQDDDAALAAIYALPEAELETINSAKKKKKDSRKKAGTGSGLVAQQITPRERAAMLKAAQACRRMALRRGLLAWRGKSVNRKMRRAEVETAITGEQLSRVKFVHAECVKKLIEVP